MSTTRRDMSQLISARTSLKLLGRLAGIYAVVCVLMYLAQRRLIYYPSAERFALPEGFEAWTAGGSGEVQGYRRLGKSDACLFFLHGNAGNARGWAHAVTDFPGDVFVLEYPGYGQRPGRPSEASLKAAALAAFEAQALHHRTVILCGQSLGCGVAPAILERHSARVAALVLITPFTSLADVAAAKFPFLPTSLLVKDRFPLFEAWRAYAGPSFVLVAGDDEVVPAKVSARYLEAQTASHRVTVIPRARHNDPEASADFWRKVIAQAQGQ
jgi:pimeloyl-ACP methyl ester carboxylesterase